MSHLIASFSGCDPAALGDITGLMKALRRAVAASGATGPQSAEERFTKDGFTAAVMTGEGRASLRTIPDQHACIVEFTCDRTCNAELFATELGTYLRARDSASHTAIHSAPRSPIHESVESRRSA
ncbi:MAG: S-adenosylmethionine decarboxylase [Deltaproteobacteria bacterium]|nr:S-adenosylmethionine decarboxylase [Deltaproteobacteria bacterium]